MKILIGNDAPESLLRKSDVRAWTQRALWFAKDGDACVLMSDPDPVFLAHVSSLTGVDPSTLRFHITPGKRLGGNFDNWALLDKDFQEDLFKNLVNVNEVRALWPSAQVAWLAENLGVADELPGADFTRQEGGTLANSKVLFRAMAASARVRTSRGGTCRTVEDAIQLSSHLLEHTKAVMIKRAYGGGGAANEILTVSQGLSTSHAGNRRTVRIDATDEALWSYWDSRLGWATCEGTEPFVVEAFVADGRSLYLEFKCDEDGVGLGQVGELVFDQGVLRREIFPAQNVPPESLVQLHSLGDRLASAYWQLGYRGPLSVDALLTADGEVTLTEVNAQHTGSTHLYEVIAHQVVRVNEGDERFVAQCSTLSTWKIPSLQVFLDGVAEIGRAYDPHRRRGVLAVTPRVDAGDGFVLFCAVVASADELEEIELALEGKFGVPASDTNTHDD